MHTWPRVAAAVWFCAMGAPVLAQTESSQSVPEDLVIESFETIGEDGGWAGFVQSEAHASDGKFAAKWAGIDRAPLVEQRVCEGDWSAYDALTFSCYSDAATGSIIYLLLSSENGETVGIDYYYIPIEVNWEGPCEIVIPFRAFQLNRSPSGWDSIDSICFTANWTNCIVFPGTVLYIDRIAVRKTPQNGKLIVSDLEFDTGTWKGLETSTVAAVGRLSGLWRISEAVPYIRTASIPHNWTGYDTLKLWLYHPAGPATRIKILLYSDDTATELVDSYYAELSADWDGWQEIAIPLHRFAVSRQPKGWGEIDSVTIAAGGWGLELPKDTTLLIDEVSVCRELGNVLDLGDFERQETLWDGLELSTEQARTGRASGKWSDLEANHFVRTTEVPSDWSEWETLEFWLYAEKANHQPLIILLYSDNTITDKIDSYNYKLTVDWTGWRRISIRKPEFSPVRQPVGWHLIQNMTIAGGGWGLSPISDTVLYIDAVTLRRNSDAFQVE